MLYVILNVTAHRIIKIDFYYIFKIDFYYSIFTVTTLDMDISYNQLRFWINGQDDTYDKHQALEDITCWQYGDGDYPPLSIQALLQEWLDDPNGEDVISVRVILASLPTA